ncbi:MAG: hypothetical protein ABIQ73_08340 [Acidimicrobiales bacterium]
MDIEASDRKHGVATGRWFMRIGIIGEPSLSDYSLHAGAVEVLEGMVDTMSKVSRADKAKALERWADDVVQPEDLVAVDTAVLRHLAELAEQRASLEDELIEAVLEARQSNRSWSEIGAMLGVSKQAAQRKYRRAVSAA